MTVSSTTSRTDYIGNGGTASYAYPMRIFAATDLDVVQATDTGIESTLSYPADFTVSGVGNRTGGAVTLTTALPSGYSLTIRRVLPLDQTTDLRTQGVFLPEVHENTFDRTTMQIQQLAEVDSRMMTLPVSVNPNVVSAIVPTPQPNRALFWNSSGTALEARVLDDSDNVALPGASRTITTLTEYLANNAVFNIKDYGAVGNQTHDDSVNMQNCLAAAPAGATVLIPKGTYRMTAASLECLRVDKPLRIVGEGFDSILLVDADTPTDVDAIRILGGYAGAPQLRGLYFGHFSILPESGNPGRHCINIDVTPGPVAYAVIDFMYLGALTSYSIQCTNPPVGSPPTPRGDGWFTSTIQDCLIAGGIGLHNAGDSIHLYRNTCFSLAGNANQLGINVALLAGSSGGSVQGFELIGGNITCAGGIEYTCGNAGVIAHLNMEDPYPSTNSRLAMINVEGTLANPIYGLTIRDNLFGAGNTNIDSIIRVDYAYGTKIEHNLTGPPIPPRLAYHILPTSKGTIIEDDAWGLSSTLPDNSILDLGRGTVIKMSTAQATAPGVNQGAYYLAHKAALSTMQLIDFGTDQYSSSVVFGVLANDPKAPLTALVTAAGALGVGGYYYRVAYVIDGVEQAAGSVSGLAFISTPGTIGKVQLSQIPVSSNVLCSARKIYRTVANGSMLGETMWYLLATIADNVTTTYLDNINDSGLGAVMTREPFAKPTAGTSAGGASTKGRFRVFGSGNCRFGDGQDIGTPVQFAEYAYFTVGATFAQSIAMGKGAYVNMRNAADTETFSALVCDPTDNSIILGSASIPTNGTDDRRVLIKYNSVEKVRVDTNGMKVSDKFGANSATPQAAAATGAVLAAYAGGANGLSSTGEMTALVNKVKAIDAALKANGICS